MSLCICACYAFGWFWSVINFWCANLWRQIEFLVDLNDAMIHFFCCRCRLVGAFSFCRETAASSTSGSLCSLWRTVGLKAGAAPGAGITLEAAATQQHTPGREKQPRKPRRRRSESVFGHLRISICSWLRWHFAGLLKASTSGWSLKDTWSMLFMTSQKYEFG